MNRSAINVFSTGRRWSIEHDALSHTLDQGRALQCTSRAGNGPLSFSFTIVAVAIARSTAVNAPASDGYDSEAGWTQSLATLRALPAIANDAAALLVVDSLARRLQALSQQARAGDGDESKPARQAALTRENARLVGQERDRLESISALQIFQADILEAIADGVITLSSGDTLTTFNRSAERTFGVTSEAMVGADARTLDTFIPEFSMLLDTFERSGAVQLRAEVSADGPNAEPLTLELRFTPLHTSDGSGVAVVVSDVTRRRELEEAQAGHVSRAATVAASFSRYLAPHVVASLMADPEAVKLGGERNRATMLFADVRGFTAIAMTLAPERVVEILNTFFDEAVRIVFAYDGLLDKFYGDGLMAVFGPPRVRADDATRAISAAVALQNGVERVRRRLDYPLEISIGLATGEVVAGHFGNAQRMSYTVIGNAVNLASRLQSAAPANAIYSDEETLAAADPGRRLTLERFALRIKGHKELVTAVSILAHRPGESVPRDL